MSYRPTVGKKESCYGINNSNDWGIHRKTDRGSALETVEELYALLLLFILIKSLHI